MHVTPNILLSQRFNNFEEMNSAVVAYSLDFRQLSRAYSDTSVDQIQAGEILYTHLSSGFYATHAGATPKKMFTFAIPDIGCPVFRYSNQVVDRPALLVARPGSEFDVLTRPGYGISTFSIPESALQEHCEAVLGCSFDALLNDSTGVHVVDTRIANQWREMAVELMGITLVSSFEFTLPSSPQSRLLECILDSFRPGEPVKQGTRVVARGKVFRRALDFVGAHRQEPLSVHDLAIAVNTTERTLERAFSQELGISPKKYLLGQRLYGAYRELWRLHRAETSVADVANAWGFWHMGQFARDYRSMFGELPSATLYGSN